MQRMKVSAALKIIGGKERTKRAATGKAILRGGGAAAIARKTRLMHKASTALQVHGDGFPASTCPVLAGV